MKETKLNAEELQIIAANNGLKRYLSGLSQGKEATPRSSLYNLPGKTEILEPDEILQRWMKTLKSLEHGTKFEQNVFQFDTSQLSKWGPQGQVAPIEELMKDIVLPTFEEQARPSAFTTSKWIKAKDIVIQKLFNAGCHSLRPASYSSVIDDMRARDTLESNSGWPLFTRRNKPEVVKQSIEEAESGQWKTYPAIALFRNYNQKTRLVWMYPMSVNLVEGSYFQPLQSRLMNGPLADSFFSPWKGFEQVRDVMTEAYGHGMCVAASDFSSTDAHFHLAATLEVYDVLKYCFQEKYRMGLRESMVYMHEIPLIVSPTSQIVGTHGVSSGSNWTNFVETIFDMIFSTYCMLMEADYHQVDFIINELMWQYVKTMSHDPMRNFVYTGLYAIGDDMTWCTTKRNHDPEFTNRLELYGESVKQLIKAEKTENYRDKVKTLQRQFQVGYLRPDGKLRAVYSTIRALKSLVYPERFHKPKLWSKDMEAIRDFMILENCVDHPLFEKFCLLVANGDPHLREVARLSSQKQNYLFRQSKLVPGLNSTYNQEKRDKKLSDFDSVKFLASH